MNKKIVVLIPSLNPNNTLVEYVKKLVDLNKMIEVIVVNDGSKNNLKHIFDDIEKINRCVVLTHAINLGKGRALKTGFNYFINNYTKKDANGIITADSDGQHSINDILKIAIELNKVKNNTLILGTRNFNLKHIPFKSYIGNKITTFIFKLLYGKKINDTQTGLRGLSYDFAKECIVFEGERFEYEINMLIEAIKTKITILESTIETIYFDNNSKTHFKPIIDSIKIYNVIFKKFFKFTFSAISSAFLDIFLFTIIYGFIKNIINPNVSIFVSTFGARIFSSLFNYIVNKKIVFNADRINKSLTRYYLLCVVQTFLSWMLVNVGYTFLDNFIHPSIIKIVVDIMLFFISFQIQQKWVFVLEGDLNA